MRRSGNQCHARLEAVDSHVPSETLCENRVWLERQQPLFRKATGEIEATVPDVRAHIDDQAIPASVALGGVVNLRDKDVVGRGQIPGRWRPQYDLQPRSQFHGERSLSLGQTPADVAHPGRKGDDIPDARWPDGRRARVGLET